MSAGQLARNRALSQGSGRSRTGTGGSQTGVTTMEAWKRFEPCATTASMFLYAQGPSILCLHHDTLALERRFQRHTEDVAFIAVDNASERGAGRLVVSYDVGQTAIVWDIFTGDEIARFVSYVGLCVASWMRNGNVAFGNLEGSVMLFEPSTSEHISARTIFDPITAIAPAADCRTYALGYNNGSILIATLQPTFTILHTLTTPRAPSPIVTLAWHGSSSKQKSDMLATQTEDGDLRVWSIAKAPNSETPKVVRVLKKSDNYGSGPNWLAWSKNGRIVQHSDGETASWDVRTKHVTFEAVPTLDSVRGLAIHGPTATLFTLGSNHTVQQFDLNPPALVANKQHPPPIPPPSPPVSIEEQKSHDAGYNAGNSQTVTTAINLHPHNGLHQTSESEEEGMSPLQKIKNEMDQIEERRQGRSGARSPTSASASSRSSAGSRRLRSNQSVSSKVTSHDGTAFSYGSSIASGRESVSTGTWASSPSIASSSRSHGRGSRLKQEVLRSPDEVQQKADLFPFTRGRLDDVPYLNPQKQDRSNWTPADLRRQMLNVIFGWEDDIESLIHDELRRHPQGSTSSMLLSKWVGDIDADVMASESMSSSDWMLLAMLSGFGGQNSTKKVGHAYVQRLLEERDIHAAATILLGLGDHNDAVEVYVSHHQYMEAVLLTSLVFPNDWQRQSSLVRKWGEWAVQHSQQHLAIRCFSCTGSETTAVLTSPRAYDTGNMGQQMQSIPQIIDPPLSPPGAKSSRITAKNSALKLITTFNDQSSRGTGDSKSKFFGMGDDDRTPMNGAGVTPIAESAISPGGGTPFLRAHSRSMRNPDSARTATPGGFSRKRLPSIGETPVDVTPRAAVPALPISQDTRSETSSTKSSDGGSLTLSSAKYDPAKGAQSPMSQVSGSVLPSPARSPFTDLKKDARTRNGSRDRKPDGLQIQWPPMESILTGDYMSPVSDQGRPRHSRSVTESNLQTPASGYSRSDFASPPITGNSLSSLNSLNSLRSPPQTGKSIDRYISSLEEAQYHAKKQRGESRRRQDSRDGQGRRGSDEGRGTRGRSHSRARNVGEASQDRGRAGTRYIKPAKRSPSSPIPMSPDDFPFGGTENRTDEGYYTISSPNEDLKTVPSVSRVRKESAPSRSRAGSNASRSARPRSPERQAGSRAGSRLGVRAGSRAASRQRSPSQLDSRSRRGRSQNRAEGSIARSPSSPLPMSPQAKLYRDEDDEELRAVQEDRKRFRSRQRSTSRRPQEHAVASPIEDPSDRKCRRHRSGSRQARERGTSSRRGPRDASPGEVRSPAIDGVPKSGNLHRTKSERTLKKEMAARELEERRKSLARRPSAPAIPTPDQLSAGRGPTIGRGQDHYGSPVNGRSPIVERGDRLPPRSKTTIPDGSHVAIGLPATPRAMRHPRYMASDSSSEDIPAVPEIPRMPTAPIPESSNLTKVAEPTLTLPSTIYTGPQRPPIRTMSAPIPEEPSSPPPIPTDLPTHPAFQQGIPHSTRRRGTPGVGGDGTRSPPASGYDSRQGPAPVYANNGPPVMISIDETIQAGSQAVVINPANNGLVPPPPPPPPILPELQHLAQPPPPPPPPAAPFMRPGHSRNASASSAHGAGSSHTSSGVINIAIEGAPDSRGPTPVIDVLPAHPPPPPPSKSAQGFHSRNRSFAESGTSRGRSVVDNSIAGKLSRATQRMRSKSGSRNRNMSPPIDVYRGPSPYESVSPPMSQMELPVRSQTTSPFMERHPREVKAGMTPEMIRAGFI